MELGVACQDQCRLPPHRRISGRAGSKLGRAATLHCLEFLMNSWTPTACGRPHWRHLLSTLATFEPSDMQQRFAAADRRIRNRGLSYRVAGEKDERVWPISRMPLLITELEWRRFAEGIAQRAESLERVLSDIYGAANLFRKARFLQRRSPALSITSPRCGA